MNKSHDQPAKNYDCWNCREITSKDCNLEIKKHLTNFLNLLLVSQNTESCNSYIVELSCVNIYAWSFDHNIVLNKYEIQSYLLDLGITHVTEPISELSDMFTHVKFQINDKILLIDLIRQ